MGASGLVQGSESWLAWRREGIGSSDAPVIAQVSPYLTPYQLWSEKTGRRAAQVEHWGMRNGKAREAEARAAYEAAHKNVVQPSCATHRVYPWMRASTDGVTLDGDLCIEIKVPNRDDHALAEQGKVPPQYWPQVQHLLAVTNAFVLHYWSWREDSGGALVEVFPNSDYIARLIAKEQRFLELVQNDEPPPLTDRDTVVREDDAWIMAALEYREREAAAAETNRRLEGAKELLKSLAGDSARCEGGGVKLTRFPVKEKTVHYKASEQTRITVVRG